jgi:hypothetical protein
VPALPHVARNASGLSTALTQLYTLHEAGARQQYALVACMLATRVTCRACTDSEHEQKARHERRTSPAKISRPYCEHWLAVPFDRDAKLSTTRLHALSLWCIKSLSLYHGACNVRVTWDLCAVRPEGKSLKAFIVSRFDHEYLVCAFVCGSVVLGPCSLTWLCGTGSLQSFHTFDSSGFF